MRRRARRIKVYSLGYLLSKQPKSLQKHQYYGEMLSYYRSSPRLQKLRISRRCYSLLQHATIKPEFLHNFYITYRLPKDPFFPLFLRVKRDYLQERERKRQAKMQYIAAKMRTLPPQILSFIKFLAAFEQHYNSAGNFPVWTLYMFPTTKKRVREYADLTPEEWLQHFRNHLQHLQQRYRNLDESTTERVLAAYVLDCLPEQGDKSETPKAGLPQPDVQTVLRNYRRLSKLHHPDLGGDGALFLQLQWAKEVLTEG
ncbi:MAG: hypothetical protein ACOCZA_07920 [Spirochaetota bacterium]